MSVNVDTHVRAFKSNVIDLVNSNNYNITSDLNAEISGILNALDSLKLDNMFLNNSHNWRSKFNEATLQQHAAAILKLISEGNGMIFELKNSLDKKRMLNMEDNQIRNINYVAKERLRAFINSIHPLSYNAFIRLDNYATNLGIRDKYREVRNEISLQTNKEKQDPIQTWTKWTDRTLPEAPRYNTPNWREHTYGLRHDNSEVRRYSNKSSSTNKNVSGSYYPDSTKYQFLQVQRDIPSALENYSQSNSLEKIDNIPERPLSRAPTRPPTRVSTQMSSYTTAEIDEGDNSWKKHAKEAGINLEFPGTTEQKYRYTDPKKADYKNFVLNPNPDLIKLGRPFRQPILYPMGTEYRSQYQFPDANKIDKFPWIKQF